MPQDSDPAKRQIHRFGPAAAFVMATVMAILWAGILLLPPIAAAAIIIAVSLLMPAALTVVMIYSGGYQRTFCIGALFPAGFAMAVLSVAVAFGVAGPMGSWQQIPGLMEQFGKNMTGFVLGIWIFIPVTGLVGMGLRFWLESTPPATDE